MLKRETLQILSACSNSPCSFSLLITEESLKALSSAPLSSLLSGIWSFFLPLQVTTASLNGSLHATDIQYSLLVNPCTVKQVLAGSLTYSCDLLLGPFVSITCQQTSPTCALTDSFIISFLLALGDYVKHGKWNLHRSSESKNFCLSLRERKIPVCSFHIFQQVLPKLQLLATEKHPLIHLAIQHLA